MMVYSSDVPYGFRLFLWAVIIKDLTKAAQNDCFIVLQDPHVGFSRGSVNRSALPEAQRPLIAFIPALRLDL